MGQDPPCSELAALESAVRTVPLNVADLEAWRPGTLRTALSEEGAPEPNQVFEVHLVAGSMRTAISSSFREDLALPVFIRWASSPVVC